MANVKELLYTFYDGSGRFKYKEDVIKYINDNNCNKFEFTYGFEYRNPTTNHEPITKEKAVMYISEGGFVDVELLENDVIHINKFSTNDMY